MPPAAISRSSTYFPKICGNIAAFYRSAFSAPLLAAPLLLACAAPETQVTTVAIAAHELGGDCALDAGGADARAESSLWLTALGPFSAEGSSVSTTVGLDEAGRELGLDARTIGIDAVVTSDDDGQALEPRFVGHSERRTQAGIEFLLWPNRRACSLNQGGYPTGGGGQALGSSARSAVALSAGENLTDSVAGSALTFETETGHATLVSREQGTLHVPRAFATVTEFGDALLVAGGSNPTDPANPNQPWKTAEVYAPATRGFDPTLIELIFPRTRHAAITLATTGETLLIGGVTPDETRAELPAREVLLFEAVSPITRNSSISELAELQVARVDPIALVLADGKILVGGGTTLGPDSVELDAGEPIGLVEWFSADGTTRGNYVELPNRAHRTFAALPGGGALSVASCRDEGAKERADCACFTASGEPCAASEDTRSWLEGTWLDSDGKLERVAFAAGDGAVCETTSTPLLVPGSDGSPWLISSRGDDQPACLWRFEPWPADAPDGAPDDPRHGPRFVPTDLTLDPPPDTRTRPASLGPDAFLWIAAGARGLAGARLGHRGPLTRDDELLAAAASDAERPEHLAPDRNPNPRAGAVKRARASFDPNLFRLKLEPPEPPESPLTVWAADTLYDDASVSLLLVAPNDESELGRVLPVLAFGAGAVGDASCPWPAPSPSSLQTGQLVLEAVRKGARVTLSVAGAAGTTACEVTLGPLAVGVRAGQGETTLTSFRIERR